MSRVSAVLKTMRKPGDKLMLAMIAGAGVMTQFLTLLSGIFAARMLGVEGRGQVVLVAVLAQIASQLTLGGSLPNAISKELAARGVVARDGLHGLVTRWLLWGLLGAVAAAAYFVVTESGAGDSTVLALAVGVAIMSLVVMTSRILIGSMLGENSDPINIAMTGVLPQLVATVVLAVALGAGVRWNAVEVVTVMILCQGLVLAPRFRLLKKPTGLPENRLNRAELARVARRTHIGSIGPLDGLSLDRALVGSLVGSAALGLYSTAVALGSLATIFGTTVAMVALPRLSAAQNAPREAEAALVRRWILASAVILLPTVAFFELANPFVIPVLFGEEFRDAVPCGYWYVAASGFLAFRRVLIVVLQARGHGHRASWIELGLTPLVFVAVLSSNLADDVAVAGMGMLAVGVVSCIILGFVVRRSAPVSSPTAAEEAVEAEVAAEIDALER